MSFTEQELPTQFLKDAVKNSKEMIEEIEEWNASNKFTHTKKDLIEMVDTAYIVLDALLPAVIAGYELELLTREGITNLL